MKIRNKNIICDKFINWIINFIGISFNIFKLRISIIKKEAKKAVLTDLSVGAISSANKGVFNFEKIKRNIKKNIENKVKISFLFNRREYVIFS